MFISHSIIRHTDTKTTHLSRSGGGGNGNLPYCGITKDTCIISNEVRGKDVLLIDDLYTRTVNIDEDAIQALLDYGAKSVVFYAVGRTVFRNNVTLQPTNQPIVHSLATTYDREYVIETRLYNSSVKVMAVEAYKFDDDYEETVAGTVFYKAIVQPVMSTSIAKTYSITAFESDTALYSILAKAAEGLTPTIFRKGHINRGNTQSTRLIKSDIEWDRQLGKTVKKGLILEGYDCMDYAFKKPDGTLKEFQLMIDGVPALDKNGMPIKKSVFATCFRYECEVKLKGEMLAEESCDRETAAAAAVEQQCKQMGWVEITDNHAISANGIKNFRPKRYIPDGTRTRVIIDQQPMEKAVNEWMTPQEFESYLNDKHPGLKKAAGSQFQNIKTQLYDKYRFEGVELENILD